MSSSGRFVALIALIQITLLLLFFHTKDGCFESSYPYPVPDTSLKLNNKTLPFEQENKSPKDSTFTQTLPPDGSFMNQSIYYRSPAELQYFHSTVHCVGDNFITQNSWKYKSCHFKNLCFDTKSHDFVIFASPEQLELEHVLSNRSLTYFSASSAMLNTSVSIGGMNTMWGGDQNMKWFPTLLDIKDILSPDGDEEGGVYLLPKNVVMIPFHSLAGMNVGHLIWDDWLPLYTILETFDYLDKEPLFIRYILERKMWASCDYHKNVKQCARMMSKFLPLLGVGDPSRSNKLWTIHDFNFETEGISAKSRYICGENGLAGLGMLTDHGTKLHGWGPKDYKSSHNQNRGGSLYNFRSYMMRNIGVSTSPLKSNNKKGAFKIVFSINSSSRGNRMLTFESHIDRLRGKIESKYDIEIVTVKLSNLNLVEQVELMSTTSILITVNGGGAVTAMFLPKGAALLVFFHDEEGEGVTPARLDWDMFNHLGYIRTHWLPRPKKTVKMRGSATGPLEVDFEAFAKLVDHELDIISHL